VAPRHLAVPRSPPPLKKGAPAVPLPPPHPPPLPPPPAPPPPPAALTDREEPAEPLLARPAPTIVLSGHLHRRAAGTSGPVLQLVFPPLFDDPPACSILEITSDDGEHRVSRTVLSIQPGPTRATETWRFDGSRWR